MSSTIQSTNASSLVLASTGLLTSPVIADSAKNLGCNVYISAEKPQFDQQTGEVIACFQKKNMSAQNSDINSASHYFLFVTELFFQSKHHVLPLISKLSDPYFKQRLFPVIMDTTLSIFSPGSELAYSKYWAEKLKNINPASSEYQEIKAIEEGIAPLIRAIRDTLMPSLDILLQNDLNTVIETIEKRRHLLQTKRFFYLPHTKATIAQESASDQIARQFEEKSVVTVGGEKGMGKSSLAIQYAKGAERYSTGVFWLDATSVQTIEDGFRKLAVQLGTSVKDVKRQLHEMTNFLLIYDNVTDGTLIPSIPSSNTLIVFNLQQCECDVTVTGFTPKNAERYIMEQIDDSEKDASLLATVLENHPAKLADAVAYIKSSKIPTESYVNYYKTDRENLLAIQTASLQAKAATPIKKNKLVYNVDPLPATIEKYNQHTVDQLSRQIIDLGIQIFVSYNQKSATREVEQMDAAFKSKGVSLLYDRELRKFDSIREFMKKVVREADYTFSIVTDLYLKSFNCLFEVITTMKDPHWRSRVFPIVLPGTNLDDAAILSYENHWQQEAARLSIGGAPDEAAIAQEGAQKIGAYLRFAREVQIESFNTQLNTLFKKTLALMLARQEKLEKKGVYRNGIFFLPQGRNKDFTGRQDKLAALESSLRKGLYSVITNTGMGGVGKSQLALEYAYRHEEYELVYWINSETMESLKSDFRMLGQELGIAEEFLAEDKIISTIKGELEKRENWLLVFDNAEDPITLHEVMPQRGGHILVTSRNPNWANTVPIDLFSEDEALAYLQRVSGVSGQDEELKLLAHDLGFLPLALTQAGAYIRRQQIDVAAYRAAFKDKQKQMLFQQERGYPESVGTAWLMSIEKITQEDPNAVELLDMCSYLAPDSIPEELLSAWLKQNNKRDAGLAFHDALRVLESYSLITQKMENYTLVLERKEDSESGEKAKAEKGGIFGSVLLRGNQNPSLSFAELGGNAEKGNIFGSGGGNSQQSPFTFNAKPKGSLGTEGMQNPKPIFDFPPSSPISTAPSSEGWKSQQPSFTFSPFSTRPSSTSDSEGSNSQKPSLFSMASKTIPSGIFGTGGKPRTSIFGSSKFSFFNPLLKGTKYKVVEKRKMITMHRLIQAVTRERCEQTKAIKTIESGIDVLNQQFDGKSGSKEEREASEVLVGHVSELLLHADELNLCTEKLGRLVDKAGVFLRETDDLQRATEMHEKALKIKRDALGDNHSSVADSYNNLGLVLQAQRDLVEAKKMHENALQIRKSTFGEDDISVAESYGNLGNVLLGQNDLMGAFEKHNDALKIKRDLLGENHPSVAICYSNLGNVHQAKGDLDAAAEMHRKALNIRIDIFGEDHILVATSYLNLGNVLEEKGLLETAKDKYEKARGIFNAVHGENHTKVAISCWYLGRVLHAQGLLDEAKNLYEKALKIFTTVLRENHTHIASTYNKLGVVLKDQDDFEGAKKMLDKALKIYFHIFGENNISVADCYHDIGDVFKAQKNFIVARVMYEKMLEIKLAVLGENHASLVAAYNELGDMLQAEGNFVDAREEYEQALKIRTRGHSPSSVAESYNQLGRKLEESGDVKGAKEIHQKALEIMKSVLGENNIQIAQFYDKLGDVCQNLGEFDEAEQIFKKVLELRLNHVNKNHVRIAYSYYSLGFLYLQKKNYDLAREYYEKAIKVYQEIKNLLDAANCYIDLGSIHEAQNNLQGAKEMYETALRLNMESTKKNDIGLAENYEKLGDVLQKLKDFDVAEKMFLKALDIRKKLFITEGNPLVAHIYAKLGFFYRVQAKYKQAQECYDRQLEISQKAKDPRGEAWSYHNLGNVSLDQGNWKRAKEMFEKGLEIQVQVFGEEHPNVAESHYNISYALRQQGNFETAKAHLVKAIEFCPEKLKIGCCHDLGFVLLELGEFRAAKDKLEEALKLYKAGIECEDMSNCHVHLGRALHKLKHLQAAKENYENCINMKVRLGIESTVEVAEIYVEFGSWLQDLGEHLAAKEQFEKALKTYQGCLESENHEAIAKCYEYLGNVHLSLDQPDHARTNYNKAKDIYKTIVGFRYNSLYDAKIKKSDELIQRQQSSNKKFNFFNLF